MATTEESQLHTPTESSTLDFLFPLPQHAGSALSPTQNPGTSHASAEALVSLLKKNHEDWHIFFNDRGFHNHTSHHLYAIYQLGATPELLEAAYDVDAKMQRKAFDSPGDITTENWKEHLGDERYYRAYVNFFTKSIKSRGFDETLEHYFFSHGANWDGEKEPQMVNRLLSGLLHPMIHSGYGCEFGAPGMLAEGLSMACVTRSTDLDAILPKSSFAFLDNRLSVSTLTRLTSALSLSSKVPATKTGEHSFSIISRMLEDPELAPGRAFRPHQNDGDQNEDDGENLQETLERTGERILRYAQEWSVNVEDKGELSLKLEEIGWLATIVYGVGGLQPGKEFNADFVLMHLVTSSLFLSAYAQHLKKSSMETLLHAYLSSLLAIWVSRGRPSLAIGHFYENTSDKLHPPGPVPTPNISTLTPKSLYPNPWLPVLQSTLLYPDEHLPKIQRCLAHYAALYGTAEKGKWKGTKLKDAELLDGSLFARVSALTAHRLGWLREGDEKGEWDFTGFWR